METHEDAMRPSSREVQASPASYFESPMALAAASWLRVTTRIKALRSWAHDERLKMRSTEESMDGGKADRLVEVRECLRLLRTRPKLEQR